MGKDTKDITISGYVVSVEPVTIRGLLNYRVRIVTPGIQSKIVYMREFPEGLEIGVYVDLKIVLSKQTGEEKLIVDDIMFQKNVPKIIPVETVIEEVSRGVTTTISCWRSGRYLSIPVEDEEILKKIPENLPAKMVCLFMDTVKGLRLISVFTEKEYRVLNRIKELAWSIDRQIEEYEKNIDDYMKNITEYV
ncbi:MAG: hypothetical protein QXH15_04050 [Nitrososphaerota archaeon]